MQGNHLKIVFIIDESGSMQSSVSDVIGGFNNYIERQRNETVGKVTVSLYKFNNMVTKVVDNKTIAGIKALNHSHYSPRGFTALYDAIGKAIQETDIMVASLPNTERPNHVLMVIITDGHENASKVFSSEAIKSLIATHENLLNWSFVYLGAGLKDFTDADLLGLNYRVNNETPSWNKVFNSVSESTVHFRFAKPTENDQIMKDLVSDLNDKEN